MGNGKESQGGGNTAAVTHRRRLSAWTTIDDMSDGGKLKAGVYKALARPDPKKHAIIDDLSLLRTIGEVPADPAKPVEKGGTLKIRFDPFPNEGLPGEKEKDGKKLDAYNQKQAALVKSIIDYCHQTLGIQCLIGFTHMDSKDTQIEKWFNLPVEKVANADLQAPRHDAFCDEIIQFCEKWFPGYDGVSFDLEGVRVSRGKDPKAEPDFALYEESKRSGEEKERLDQLGHQESDFYTWRVTTNITRLYGLLGCRLTSAPLRKSLAGKDAVDRGWDRIVAFAGSGVIGALPQPPDPSDTRCYKSRLLEWQNGEIVRKGTRDFETRKGIKPLVADDAFRMHDYFGIRGVRNVIIRPMAYDNFNIASSDHDQSVDGWHADIVRYVKRVMNLHPGNFQLGIKTFQGASKGGWMGSPKWVKRRCTDTLAPEDLGVCLFQASSMFWKDANDGLNPTNPESGYAKEPVQVPLNAKAAAFYNPPKTKP